MRFFLYFNGPLYHDNDAYELMKQYNQLIKQKQHLESLSYNHIKIRSHTAYTKQEIEELIDRVDKS